MSSQSLKVGVVGLAEAGNLGDDLILIATVNAIYEADPGAEVAFLSFGQALDWVSLAKTLGYIGRPHRILARPEIPLLRQNSRVYRDRDVIIFGGGGLIQTSHSKNLPYTWLSYLPATGRGAPRVLATGLGLGPISEVWLQRLGRMSTPFDLAWFRDADSLALSRDELGWRGVECRDFIDQTFLESLPFARIEGHDETRRLGVALRAWPNFSVEDAAAHIESVIRRHECEEVTFFVLESNKGRGIDVDFSEEIAGRLSRPARIRAYEAQELTEFLEDMSTVNLAISMKLHSSAIWSTLRIPIYPIIYAPKVAALFGRDYHGFEVVDAIIQIPAETEDVPRSHQTVVTGLRELAEKRIAVGGRISLLSRFRYQSTNLIRAVTHRFSLLVHSLKRAAR